MPVEMADLNGDGFMDLVLAPMAANGGNGSRPESGEVYVYPGNGQIEGTIDRGAFAGSPPGLTVWGAREGDFLGTALYTADVNGDGVQDLLLSEAMMVGKTFRIDQLCALGDEAFLETFRLSDAAQRRDFAPFD